MTPWRQLESVLLVSFVLVVEACVVPTLHVGTVHAASLLTPTQARGVVMDYWKVEQQVVAGGSDRLDQIQTGLLREASSAGLQSPTGLGLLMLPPERPLQGVIVYVPRRDHYPLEFLALVRSVQVDQTGHLTNVPFGAYLHFVKPTAQDLWKADFFAVADLGRPIQFALDGAGYAALLRADATQYIPKLSEIGTALGHYLQTGLDSGSPEGPFVPGPLTSNWVSELGQLRAVLYQDGYDSQYQLSTRPYLVAYKGASGYAVVLFALQVTNTVRLIDSSKCLVQADDRSTFGPLVAPGAYAAVSLVGVQEYIASESAKSGSASVDVVAGSEDEVAAHTQDSGPGACHR